MLLNRLSRQRGAFLTIVVILIVVLLGFGALILDVGRIMVLRAEMQNAIDSAALAAARELDGKAEAQTRAKNAARHALALNSHFAREIGLLGEEVGETTLPDGAFTFYCIIGSKFDPDPDDADISHFCGDDTPDPDDPNKFPPTPSTSDTRTHYVRVSMLPELVADHFTIDLIFFPLLRLIGAEDIIDELALSATALAGRGFFACNFPPLAICDPWEDEGGFRENMVIGGSIQMKAKGGESWAAGNYGLLKSSKFSGDEKYDFYADEGDVGCQPVKLNAAPGLKLQKVKSAFNTRFGIYDKDDDIYGNTYSPVQKPGKNAETEYPAAPNVVDYPKDTGTNKLINDSRFGDGQWNCEKYWNAHHPLEDDLQKPLACTNNTSTGTLSRWDLYNSELGTIPFPRVDEDDDPDTRPTSASKYAMDCDSYTGPLPCEPGPANDTRDLNRRHIFVAVLSCDALGIKGASNKDFTIFGTDGFAEIFLIKPASDNEMSLPEEDRSSIFGEYIGWGDEDDELYHIDVVLFE